MTTHELAKHLLTLPNVPVRAPSHWQYVPTEKKYYVKPDPLVDVVGAHLLGVNVYILGSDHNKNPNKEHVY